jgi:ATP synthase protein I
MVRRVMADNQAPRKPEPPGADVGWAALSYLIGGILVWGFVGWVVDRWLSTGGIATAVGCVLGAAGGIYLLVRRIGV